MAVVSPFQAKRKLTLGISRDVDALDLRYAFRFPDLTRTTLTGGATGREKASVNASGALEQLDDEDHSVGLGPLVDAREAMREKLLVDHLDRGRDRRDFPCQ